MQLKFSDNNIFFDIDILENFSFYFNDTPDSPEDSLFKKSIYWGNLSLENQNKLLQYEKELRTLLLPKLEELKTIAKSIDNV
jgi:hypothetical protein